MCRFAFGYDGGSLLGPNVTYLMWFWYKVLPVANFFYFWNYLPFLPMVSKMNQCGKNIRSVVEVMVRKRKEKGVDPEDQDLLAELIRGDEEGKIDEEILVQNCFQMIIAGDTTSGALTTLLYYLGLYPEVQEKLRKEIISATSQGSYSFAEISKCDYLHMVIKEALRICPPVRGVVPRCNTETLQFSGYDIPPGSEICYCTYAVHHNEKYWGDPSVFRPERWENKGNLHSMAWFPFLGGNRNCIGQGMAVLELKTTLVELLRKYKVSLDPNYKLKLTVSWVNCPTDLNVIFTPLVQ